VSAGLAVAGLAAGYGGFHILSGFAFDVRPDRITVIVGPNGAGKSTLLKALAGLLPREGTVKLDGRVLPPVEPAAAVRAGLILVAEGRHLFPRMTVWENLELGGWSLARHERAARVEQALALVARPRLLMLDEPSLGLAPSARRRGLRHRPPRQGRGRHRAPDRAERRPGPGDR